MDYRGLTDSPADLAGNVLDVGNYLQAGPTRRHCTWVFSVMNHLNATTPQDESPRLCVGLRLDGEAGSLPDD